MKIQAKSGAGLEFGELRARLQEECPRAGMAAGEAAAAQEQIGRAHV